MIADDLEMEPETFEADVKICGTTCKHGRSFGDRKMMVDPSHNIACALTSSGVSKRMIETFIVLHAEKSVEYSIQTSELVHTRWSPTDCFRVQWFTKTRTIVAPVTTISHSKPWLE